MSRTPLTNAMISTRPPPPVGLPASASYDRAAQYRERARQFRNLAEVEPVTVWARGQLLRLASEYEGMAKTLIAAIPPPSRH